MKTRRTQTNDSKASKRRPSRRRNDDPSSHEEWKKFGADFLRAVTSGSMADDREVFAELSGIR